MRFYLIFLTLFYFISINDVKSYSPIPQDTLGRHLWYIELAGVNYSISFNYEYIFSKDTLLKLSLRTGIGGTFFFISRYGIPVMMNFIIGREKCVDVGFGLLFDKVQYLGIEDYPTQAIKFIGNIGYRYVGESGFLFKIGLTPIYFADRGFLPIIGISLGHYF